MDRLLAADEIVRTEYIGKGPFLLDQFVQNKKSITRTLKDRARALRLGDKASPKAIKTQDILNSMFRLYLIDNAEKTLQGKQFHLNNENEFKHDKNYNIKQQFGANRNLKPYWEDPHPVKYGGETGLQALRDKLDTGY